MAILASGSLTHRVAQNGLAPEYASKMWSPFLEQLDHHGMAMWQRADGPSFCEMLSEYATKGYGDGFMHGTAMLLGAAGWKHYDGRADVVTPFFSSSGSGQINAVFPVTPMPADLPPPGASAAPAQAGSRL